MNNIAISIGIFCSFAFSYSALADNAIIKLAPGGSFVVQDSTGTQQVLSVRDNGELWVNGRPADFTPPTITGEIPTVASGFYMSFSYIVTDNLELGAGFAEGEKTATRYYYTHVPLDGDPVTGTLSVTDTSGNVGKRNFSIAPPETAIKFGIYQISGSNQLPLQFDCRPNHEPGPEGVLKDVTVSVRDNFTWSIAYGFDLGISINFELQPPDINFGPWYGQNSQVPLLTTTFSFFTGYNGSYRIVSEFRVIQPANPAKIEFDLEMQCSTNGTGWISGAKGTYTAIYNQPLPKN